MILLSRKREKNERISLDHLFHTGAVLRLTIKSVDVSDRLLLGDRHRFREGGAAVFLRAAVQEAKSQTDVESAAEIILVPAAHRAVLLRNLEPLFEAGGIHLIHLFVEIRIRASGAALHTGADPVSSLDVPKKDELPGVGAISDPRVRILRHRRDGERLLRCERRSHRRAGSEVRILLLGHDGDLRLLLRSKKNLDCIFMIFGLVHSTSTLISAKKARFVPELLRRNISC